MKPILVPVDYPTNIIHDILSVHTPIFYIIERKLTMLRGQQNMQLIVIDNDFDQHNDTRELHMGHFFFNSLSMKIQKPLSKEWIEANRNNIYRIILSDKSLEDKMVGTGIGYIPFEYIKYYCNQIRAKETPQTIIIQDNCILFSTPEERKHIAMLEDLLYYGRISPVLGVRSANSNRTHEDLLADLELHLNTDYVIHQTPDGNVRYKKRIINS